MLRPTFTRPLRVIAWLAEHLTQLHAAAQQGRIIQPGPPAIEEPGQDPRVAPHAALHRLFGECEAHPRRDDGERLAANRLVRAPDRTVVVPEDDLRAETLVRQAGIDTNERARAVFAPPDPEL